MADYVRSLDSSGTLYGPSDANWLQCTAGRTCDRQISSSDQFVIRCDIDVVDYSGWWYCPNYSSITYSQYLVETGQSGSADSSGTSNVSGSVTVVVQEPEPMSSAELGQITSMVLGVFAVAFMFRLLSKFILESK